MILSGREVFCAPRSTDGPLHFIEIPPDSRRLIVGTSPVLTTEDTDGSYVRLSADTGNLGDYYSMFYYVGLRLNPVGITPQQLAGMTVRVTYRGLPAMFDPAQYVYWNSPTQYREFNELSWEPTLESFDETNGVRAVLYGTTAEVTARGVQWGLREIGLYSGAYYPDDTLDQTRAKLAAGNLGVVVYLFHNPWVSDGHGGVVRDPTPMANILDVSSIVVTIPDDGTLSIDQGPLTVNFR